MKLDFIKNRDNIDSAIGVLLIILSIFVDNRFLYLFFSYYVALAIYDIYKIYADVWYSDKKEVSNYDLDNAFGAPLIGYFIGGGIWYYIDVNTNLLPEYFVYKYGVLIILVLIFSLLSIAFLVSSIHLIHNYKINNK